MLSDQKLANYKVMEQAAKFTTLSSGILLQNTRLLVGVE